MSSEVPGVEHRDTQYFGYYAMLQHQVTIKRNKKKGLPKEKKDVILIVF